MVILVASLLKGIFIAINSIDPHTKELVGNRIYFIYFCNNIFSSSFLVADCTELADVRLYRLINFADVTFSASPTLAMA